MPTVVGVILRHAAKPTLFDASGLELASDDVVVLNTERGEELGRVSVPTRELAAGESLSATDRVVRAATREDLERAAELHRREREGMARYRRLVEKHRLDMKPTDIEMLLDGSRAVFYFVAEERVDFRDLVRDLSSEFGMRVDMRQIGVRDEARMIGGLGHCGEQLCCDRFCGEFQPVSIRMAKEQDLPLNPLKISGLCGRLMCCLRYEYEAYKDFKGRAPKKGAIIDVGGDKAKVIEFHTPRETMTVRKEDGTRLTVALADMECCSGQGCPCSVKAEALERDAATLGGSIPAAVATTLRERTLTEADTGPRAAVVAPSEGAGTGSGQRKRRRRRGGEGSGEPAQQPAAGAEAPKPSRRSRRGGGSGAASGAPGGSAASAAPQGAPPGAAQASGDAASPARKRRRRRRRGSGSGGEAAAE